MKRMSQWIKIKVCGNDAGDRFESDEDFKTNDIVLEESKIYQYLGLYIDL